MEPGGLLTTY